jgi:hypothetical protein
MWLSVTLVMQWLCRSLAASSRVADDLTYGTVGNSARVTVLKLRQCQAKEGQKDGPNTKHLVDLSDFEGVWLWGW